MSDGKALYEAFTANHPDIHCNRFPAWDELTQETQCYWHNRSFSWALLKRAYRDWPANLKARISIHDLPYMTWEP